MFSFWRRKSAEDAIATIAQEVVSSAIRSQSFLAESSEKRAPYVGAEVAYLFLHLIDRQLFHTLGASRRGAIYDQLADSIVTVYTLSVFRPRMPQTDPMAIGSKMLDTLNSRQETYSRCDSLLGGELPGQGSMIFALGFFIHQILGHTTRGLVDEILAGTKPIPDGELDNFPGPEALLRTAIYIGSSYKEMPIEKELKHLR